MVKLLMILLVWQKFLALNEDGTHSCTGICLDDGFLKDDDSSRARMLEEMNRNWVQAGDDWECEAPDDTSFG